MVKWFESLFIQSHVFTLNLTIAFLLIVGITICSIYITDAFAHETVILGNFSITPGWEVEPPLVNQLNSIEINFTRNEAEGNSVAVRNAFSELDASIKSGGLTKSLDFEPQEESAGLYRAAILPTQVGSYSLVLIGSIDGQTINSELSIEDVEDTAKFAFPLAESQGSSGSSVLSAARGQEGSSASQAGSSMVQLSPLLSDLTRQINSTGDAAIRAEAIAEETRQSLEQLGDSVDRAYVFGMVSVGIGISGIIIGAYALTRNQDRFGILGRRKRT
ncbi:MAG TPA: hypothetical protein VE378_06860 [Nitrososphaeraceae archaeon]|nr:hypothetical protein [Nitrososphaeraceae archaeon]